MKNHKYLMFSFSLFILCLIVWQLSNFTRINIIQESSGMGALTSLAVLGFLGTLFFFITTLSLFLITILKKRKPA